MRISRGFALIFVAVFLAGALPSRAGTLIDVAFTGAAVTTKTGFAATGVTTNDFWNTYGTNLDKNYETTFGLMTAGVLSQLKFVDGTTSGAGLTFTNEVVGPVGTYINGASDP